MAEPRTSPTPEQQRAAEELFDLVRTLPEAEREATILARAPDPWVRAEVRSLLQFDEQTVATLGSARDEHFDATKCIGFAVGGFTLRAVLGVGGMGTVFEAEQELPARRIAVKVLHAATARASTLARFRKESDFLARLDHPNIARVIAAGTLHVPGDATPRPYFAMELVDGGRSLTRWAREDRPSRANIVRMFLQACDAVGSGHRAGIAHLDLKPGNLLVSRTNTLRVIDYGIARSLDATEDAPDASLAGTPQYMSPEQVTRGARVDSRADVYALGLILYELLAARLPYETRGLTLAEVTRTVRESAPTPLALIDATIPADLAAIVAKSIAKDPDARYGTASELADDLRRWLADEPVLAAPGGFAKSTMRAIRRNPLVATLAAIAALAGVAAAVFAARLAITESREAANAKRDAARAYLRVASGALAIGDPADAFASLYQVPEGERGWESRHLVARYANFELFSNAGTETYSVLEVPATGELIAGVTGTHLHFIDLTGSRPTEVVDLSPAIGNKAESSFIALTATADGKTVVANLVGGNLVRYDRATATFRRLPYGAGFRSQIAGDRVVCTDFSAGVAVHDLATDRPIAQLPGAGVCVDASFSSDARTVVMALDDGRIRCAELSADLTQVRERWITAPNPAHTRAVAISPDASTIAVSWKDGRIARLSATTGATELERDLEGGSVFDLQISPDNATAAASSWSPYVRLIDMHSLGIRERLGGTITHVWNIAWSADGARLFGRIARDVPNADGTVSNRDCVGAWRMQQTRAIRETEFGRILAAAAALPDGTTHLVAAPDGWMALWTPADGSVRELRARGGAGEAEITAVALWRGEVDRVAIGHADGSVILGQIADGSVSERQAIHAVDGRVNALRFSPDGAMVGCGTEGATVAMLDVAQAKVAWRQQATTAALSPGRAQTLKPIFLDGGRLVTFVTSLVNAPRLEFRTSDGAVEAGRTSPAAWEYSDGVVRPGDERMYMLVNTGPIVTDRGAGPEEQVPLARNGGILAIDREGTRLFAATTDGTVRVAAFDPVTQLMRLEAPGGRPLSLGFDDGRDELTVITSRGVARTWCGSGVDIPEAPEQAKIDRVIGGNPTSASPGAAQR